MTTASAPAQQLRFGFILSGAGAGWGDWRHPDANPAASTSLPHYLAQARAAERGGLDFLFVADSLAITAKSGPHYLNRFEPLTILSALASATERIGLVGTLSSSYSEPFNVARQFASLDHISGGRAGWNVVTSWRDGTAENFGREAHPDHDRRYRLAAEHLDVVQGLWDSWEDDALLHDKAGGRFFDADKLHALDHEGEFFRVRGPLNIARSPQGQPVVFQAGASEQGRDFAARRADAIFAIQPDIDAARAYRSDLRGRALRHGRTQLPLVFPGIRPVSAPTAAEAEEKFAALAALQTPEQAIAAVGWHFNDFDFSGVAHDTPFAAIPGIEAAARHHAPRRILEEARADRLTLIAVARRHAVSRTHFVGSHAQVAGALADWLAQGAADGFNISEALPGSQADFIDGVLPLLRRRGLARDGYGAGRTLRDHLGLDIPVNRHAAEAGSRDVSDVNGR
ncbi:NtaA/DmoA family FMN-dependent monooxygenase [Xylophilus sp.]|uniref:NtaA/DmoA family FMN-dependent monooxygenase n=1 Tax=Xylophilus sp. TaxID=2653893 RepID=UPI0013BE7EC0|nr:NtaA/DmoA family FMN-dependent monooxygenase [Xylophilus sp.]KAF1045901.1 MAG: putative monooxygenase MoxC [Xylophilus sp.]